MPPKTVRVKPVKNANASAGGGKAAATSTAGKGGKGAKSTAASSKPAAAPVAGKKTAAAAAPKPNMVREVKPMTPVTPRVKEKEMEEEETEEPPSYVQHENMMYNEYGLDGRRILSPEPTSRWGRYWKRARKAYRATAFYRKKRDLKQRWRDYREKKRQ